VAVVVVESTVKEFLLFLFFLVGVVEAEVDDLQV
jgi:hypothetical protein